MLIFLISFCVAEEITIEKQASINEGESCSGTGIWQ
jgi:hypothetical protein